MIQEKKDLLLKDLCARLPYGVKCKGTTEELVIDFNGDIVRKNVEIIDALSMINLSSPDGVYVTLGRNGVCDIDTIKPYLRPISNMTEEEEQEYRSLCAMQFDELADANTTIFYFDTIESFDWLNKKMFDYRGLIPKGLALSTEIYNPYKD